MFDWLRPKKSPDAKVHVVHTTGGGRKLDPQVIAVSQLRRRQTIQGSYPAPPKKGMWVVYEHKTGILITIEPGDVATVMLVDDVGHNVVEIHVPAVNLRQAWFEEIPEARRPALELAQRFGYHPRPV